MTRTRRAIPHLFKKWVAIADRIKGSKRLVIFLDFDGTLAPIAPLPGFVKLAPGARSILQTLASRRRLTLAVISGRRRAELLDFIGIRKVKYLGLYGWEHNGNARLPSPVQIVLDRALLDVRAALANYPGVWIESKGSSFSVHLLGARAEVRDRARRAVKTHLKPMRVALRAFANLRDIEVAPVLLGDKGVAVRKFLGEQALRDALPIYFGDDLSDEPAFAAVRKGISVVVGKRRPTRAQFFLRGPEEVPAALSRMEAMLR